MPAPNHYAVKPVTPWGAIDSKNNSDQLFPRKRRDVIAQEIENLNLRKEMTTPSPGYYTPSYKHVEPTSNKGAASLKM